MADITVVAASVVAGSNVVKEVVTAGATVTAGQPVYLDTTAANKAKPCDADALASSRCYGIALDGAAINQPLVVAKSGTVTLGPAHGSNVGEVVCVSTTAGGIAPFTDIAGASGDYVTVLGTLVNATDISINIQVSGVAYGS